MDKALKILLLGLLLLLNLIALGSGVYLGYDLWLGGSASQQSVEPGTQQKAAASNRARYKLAHLQRIYRFYDSHPDISLRKAQLWFKSNPAIYAALYDPQGNLLFRMRKTNLLDQTQKEKLMAAFASQSNPTQVWEGQQTMWLHKYNLIVLRSNQEHESLQLHLARKASSQGALDSLSQYSSGIIAFLKASLGIATHLLALGLILIGGSLSWISLSYLRSNWLSIQATELDAHENHNAQTVMRIKQSQPQSKPAPSPGQTDYLNQLPPLDASQQKSLQEHLRYVDPVTEQSDWNLPGFQSVKPLALGRKELQAAGDWQRYFQDQSISESDYSGQVFNHNYYNYTDLGTWTQYTSSVKQWARQLILETSSVLQARECLLMLENRQGQMQALLKSKGHLFISGSDLELKLPDSEIIEELRTGHYSIGSGGHEIWFPILASQHYWGLLYIKSSLSLFNRDLIERAWDVIRKFSLALQQVRVFEQATRDPASSLANGLSFSQELKREYQLLDQSHVPRQLCLIKIMNWSDDRSMQLIGQALNQHWDDRHQLFRIAQDVIASLGSHLKPERLSLMLDKIQNHSDRQSPNRYLAAAVNLARHHTSSQQWFEECAQALEDAMAAGPNSLLYKSDVKSKEFFRATN